MINSDLNEKMIEHESLKTLPLTLKCFWFFLGVCVCVCVCVCEREREKDMEDERKENGKISSSLFKFHAYSKVIDDYITLTVIT